MKEPRPTLLASASSSPACPLGSLGLAPKGQSLSPELAQNSFAFWEMVVDLLSEAVFLVGPDRRIVYWNRAAEQLTGYQRDEVLGSPCLRAVHCEVCEHRCGVFEFGDVRDVPLQIRNRSGQKLEVLKSATVVRGPQGEVLLGIEVLRDMTAWNERERLSQQARQQAEQQKALLQGVLDAVRDGVIGVGRDEIIRFFSSSAQAALEMAEPQALGQPVQRLLGSEITAMVRHVLQSGTSVSRARLVVQRPDGLEVPLSVAVSPLMLPDEPQGAMVRIGDLREEERQMRERSRAQGFSYGTLVTRSPRMQEVFDLVDQVAPTLATVLIQGESGTGKELVAREIHKRSRRAGGPFHAVNCAAIASEILESEFFGHERGAFTGAVSQKAGRFEVAHTGTIFLDEVAELPLDLQSKLLRVLEQRAFERVGGTKTIQVDVRVIAATHRDLGQMVRQGRFREDLYYRLRVVPLRIPSLRERMEDVELLAEHFLRRFSEREGKNELCLTQEALQCLLDYPWRGNVRELSNAMEYAAVVCKGPHVSVRDLPREIRQLPDSPKVTEPSFEERGYPRPEPASLSVGEPEADLLGSEKVRIETALRATHYSHGKAAALLGMHRTTLYRKRLRYGV